MSALAVTNTLMVTRCDRVTELRDYAEVKRFHGERVSPQSVGEHQYGVAMIIFEIVDAPTINLIRAALTHDMAERQSGDMPAPVKWAYPDLAARLQEIEDEALEELGFNFKLTEEEKVALKIADYLEASFYCYEQRMLGNRYADEIFRRLLGFFRKNEAKLCQFPKAKEIHVDLSLKYQKLSGGAL
jgi:5'-deoxynucleotidase YfbR-like HD superfamily hydrolase